MEFIDEYLSNGGDITEYFIRELHRLVVAGLQQEGDRTPGASSCPAGHSAQRH